MEALMHFSLSRPRAAAAATAVVALAAGLTATQAAPAGLLSHLKPQVGAAGDESTGVNTALAERAQARTAPTGAVAPGAYEQAAAALAALPTTTLGAHTVTTGVPYDADDPNYRDPAASN